MGLRYDTQRMGNTVDAWDAAYVELARSVHAEMTLESAAMTVNLSESIVFTNVDAMCDYIGC